MNVVLLRVGIDTGSGWDQRSFRGSAEQTAGLSARRHCGILWAERESNPHSQRRLIYS